MFAPVSASPAVTSPKASGALSGTSTESRGETAAAEAKGWGPEAPSETWGSGKKNGDKKLSREEQTKKMVETFVFKNLTELREKANEKLKEAMKGSKG
jgi:hypothetical protein